MSSAMPSVAPEVAPELAYHRLRASLNEFGKGPDALEPSQSAAVERRARQEHALERRVLSSPEACEVVLPEATVEQALETIRVRYPDAMEFEADLDRNGLNPTTLRVALERELTAEAVLDRIGARAAKVGDLEVRLYYYLHHERFVQPETRTLRHILITVNDEFPENCPAEARARIEGIAARLRRKPQRFAEQAGKHSECPTALRGGLLGRLPRGQLFAELDEVAFGLGEGEVSDVVQSPVGLHVLWCEEIHPAGPVPLSQARARIVERLEARQRRLCIGNWLRRLSDKEE